MPATVIPIDRPSRSAAGEAVWSLLEIVPAGHDPVPFGILLVDRATGKLTMRFQDAAMLEDLEEQEIEILEFLESDLAAKALESGGEALLASFEQSLSGFLRISDRTAVALSEEPRRMVDRLFEEHVDSAVRPFETHLPLYSLRAAATKFGEGMTSEQEGWVRAPGDLTLHDNMFVARVVGRSMEPLIPDGSLCIFRAGVTGSRNGRRLLIEQFGETDFTSRYTVKRYSSIKRPSSEDENAGNENQHIRLEPLNKEFPAFDLGPEGFRVIAEFVRVL
jgi:SOS-response transcriptional repressor LexA